MMNLGIFVIDAKQTKNIDGKFGGCVGWDVLCHVLMRGRRDLFYIDENEWFKMCKEQKKTSEFAK